MHVGNRGLPHPHVLVKPVFVLGRRHARASAVGAVAQNNSPDLVQFMGWSISACFGERSQNDVVLGKGGSVGGDDTCGCYAHVAHMWCGLGNNRS